MSVMAWLERALMGPVDRARVTALERMVFGLLAFDLWVEMAPHGSRYGAGGLNVAHFSWLDAVQGLPDAGTYLAVVFASGVLCLSLAFGFGGRVARWAVFGLYTYGWAMSQLDSYQHHFFLSIVLFHFALADSRGGADAPERGCAWAYQLQVASIAIVYGYTSLSKTEEGWLMGDVLVRINASDGKLEPFLSLAQNLGLSAESFWWLGGHLVVLVQWIIEAGYLAVFLDPDRRRRSTFWLATAGLGAALAFHVGAEYLELRVGWFSYYMLLLGVVMLGPVAPWRSATRLVTGPAAVISSALINAGRPVRLLVVMSVFVAAWAGTELVDLPSSAVLGITGLVLFVYDSWSLKERGSFTLNGAKVTCVLVLAILSLTHSNAHYDFFRFLGGDLVRRGAPVEALDAYGMANTWAPEGAGRQSKVRKIQAGLPSGLK